ncbi:MAG: sigma-54-dependent Fis family transcriptional regulator [Desulfofustis sp.]|nr:sigma-54-dependent Fis family transcriptional regulator [Desulfofustis sp.]
MSQSINILIALADQSDGDALVETIANRFPDIIQKRVDAEAVIVELRRAPCAILLLDSRIKSGYPLSQLLKEISAESKNLAIILLVDNQPQGHLHADLSGRPFFQLTFPVQPAELNFCVNHCLTLLNGRNQPPNSKPKTSSISGFIGKSRAMKDLFEIIRRVAEDDYSTVLIRGESGTGKELVAKAIHQKSGRRKHNFVPVNCAAIPDELLESELFGHLKGSFTGAGQNKTGRIQYADNGTLFLDEIGDMKPNLQAKLLRVIQEREFEPVGSLRATPINTRIVAATHCDLEELVKEGRFREDLYYRLSVIPLEVPPLRSRSEDIPLLLSEFIKRHTVDRGRDKIVFSSESMEILSQHSWCGNVRELENLVQHMAILYSGKRIYPHHLPVKFTVHRETGVELQVSQNPPVYRSENDISAERAALFSLSSPPTPSVDFQNGPIDFNDLINEFETDLIIKALKFTSGNKKEASRMLCLKRTTLLEKIKKKEIDGRWDE